MRLLIERRGVSPTARTPDLPGWRQWAYEECAGQSALEAPIIVEVRLGCQDRRGMATATSAWQVVEAVLAGAAAAGVLRVEDVIQTTIHRPVVAGESVFELRLIDGSEPF